MASEPTSRQSVARLLGQFVVECDVRDIPLEAMRHGAMLVSSTVASAAMGSRLVSAAIIRKLLIDRAGTEEAVVWFAGGVRLPLAFAARINALMSDAAASDDSDLRNITHPGTPLVASVLAVADKTGASGQDCLAAIVLGYEVAGRINTGVIPGLIWEKGLHGCMVAIFGAAVGAGRLFGLDADKMATAIGLAATSVSGLLAAANTSMAREHHAGLAAMLGLEAAQLAMAGYTVEQSVLEHPRGFFHAYGVDAHASGRVVKVTEGFGTDWQILENMGVKLVPGGHPYHSLAEAAAKAATACDAKPEDIVSIVCRRPDAHQITGPRHPTELIGMAHSPYYFAAAGAADRTFSWQHASQQKIMDPAIRRLLDLVEIGEPPTERVGDYRQGVTVSITTKDGRSATETVFAPRGSAVNGISWDDIDNKFRTLAPNGGLSEGQVDTCVRMSHAFAELVEARDFTRALH